MYVVDVIPFSRSAPPGTLSYRSRTELPEGTVVEVSLRRKHVQGLVVSCQSVAEAKATLKNASFLLTKDVPHIVGSLPDALRDAAHKTAEYHAATLGSTLAALLGEQARSDVSLVHPLSAGTGFVIDTTEHTVDERASAYEALIASATENGAATLLVVPTLAEIEYWKQTLASWKPVVLSGALVGRKREDALAASVSGARLIIATPMFAWTPFPTLGRIIIERAGAGSYRMQRRPYLDMRIALRELAKARELPLTFGDLPVPLEYRTHPEASLQSTVKGVTLIDARRDKEIPQGTATEPWSALPKNLREHIGMAAGAGGRVLVLAVRKGYAPSVICRDCGTARTDEHGNVLTFTKSGPNGHAFRTVEGKILESTDVLCEVCGSWNLLPLGVGVERVEEELRAQFPDSRVIRFEGDTVRTAASARKALEHAREPGAIIIGTEAALPWLLTLKLQPFDLGAIASADSLLALPFWRARERFVRIGFLLSSMSKQTYLGTRLPDDTAARLLQNPTDPTFFQEEASLRRALHYPPFGTLVVLQAEGTRAALTILDASIRNAVGDHAVTVLPHRALTRTELRRSFVVHLKEGAWPDKNLALHLRALSPAIRILIDPESF